MPVCVYVCVCMWRVCEGMAGKLSPDDERNTDRVDEWINKSTYRLVPVDYVLLMNESDNYFF